MFLCKLEEARRRPGAAGGGSRFEIDEEELKDANAVSGVVIPLKFANAAI